MRNFLHFSRVHTIIGTTLSITALYVLALSFSTGTAYHAPLWLLSLLACLGANIYIVGLNQVTDVEIDRINKPYLPLASGAWTMRKAVLIIISSVLLSLLLALLLGRFLLLTVVLSLILGTLYSLPPFRLKRFTFWAAFCIIAVRGLIVNLLLFLHFHSHINGRTDLPAAIWLLTGVIFVYSIVIAWFKDMPDMEGDRAYRIRTLSLRLGARRVWLIGNALLTISLLAVAITGWTVPTGVNGFFLTVTHLGLLCLLWVFNGRLDLRRRESVRKYYQSIWLLFFLEYIVFAVAGLA